MKGSKENEERCLRGRPVIDLGTGRVLAMLCAAGHPERAFKVVHVAGTNGKGSTCLYTAAALQRVNHTLVGLFVSPALCEPNDAWLLLSSNAEDDRQRVRAASRDEYAAHCRVAHGLAPDATNFEIEFIACMMWFAKAGVAYAVVETGLGGRDDATNVFKHAVCPICSGKSQSLVATAITRIGLDHVALLGNTVFEIAAHKAGIAAAGVPCIIARQSSDDVTRAIEAAAVTSSHEAPILFTHVTSADVLRNQESQLPSGIRFSIDSNRGKIYECEIDCGQAHQGRVISRSLVTRAMAENLANAMAIVVEIGAADLEEKVAMSRLARDVAMSVGMPGRAQRISCAHLDAIVDGCHNDLGACALRGVLHDQRHEMATGRLLVVLAVSGGRDPVQLLRSITIDAGIEVAVAVVAFTVPENMPWVTCAPPREVAAALDQAGYRVEAVADSIWDLDPELRNPTHGSVVVAGSLYLVADVYRGLMARGVDASDRWMVSLLSTSSAAAFNPM